MTLSVNVIISDVHTVVTKADIKVKEDIIGIKIEPITSEVDVLVKAVDVRINNG